MNERKQMKENDNNKIPPVLPGFFTLPPYEEHPPMLLGGYCAHCDRYFFPKPRYCPECLDIPETREMGNRGRIHSFTVVRAKPPLGLPRPYAVGYVDLDPDMAGGGLRVFSLLDPDKVDALRIGARVVLHVSRLGQNRRGEPCLRPLFKPLEEAQEGP